MYVLEETFLQNFLKYCFDSRRSLTACKYNSNMREFGYDGETTTGGVKKALLRISQISQENTCVGVFF